MTSDRTEETVSTPRFPHELWRPIMNSLTVHEDRHTLCTVALTSKLLGYEAQRVLFSATTYAFWTKDPFRRHVVYLSAILNAPKCLGPMVHIYSQVNLATDPYKYPGFTSVQYPDSDKLWELTMKTLPAMINLKRIQFCPRIVPTEFSLKVLNQGAFRFINLTWAPPRRYANQVIIVILHAPARLVHLDLSHSAQPIPTYVCPNLISIRATHSMWVSLCLAEGHSIRALEVVADLAAQHNNIEDNKKKDALATCANNIHILSCQSYGKLCLVFGEEPLHNLVLLRLSKCTVANLLRISGFDSMQVLVLQKVDLEGFYEGVVSSHLLSVFNMNANTRYVDIQTVHRGVFQRYYRPMSDAMDQRPTVKLFRGNHATELWWDCHLDEADYILNNGSDTTLDRD